MFKVNRVLRAAYIAFGVAVGGSMLMPNAFAQSSEGSIAGQATAGAAVTITDLDSGLTRQGTADKDGNFAFVRLQPGRYKIASGSVTKEVYVAIGSGTQVSLKADTLDRVQIVGGGRSVIDVSSTESNSVFTQAQIQALPVARNIESVALLAPGVVQGDITLASGRKLPSFGGASVAENGYYINGFDVTNIRNFTAYAELPFDAISQQQVKTGGFGAEYGRSLGGVMSIVTKRGTNEWHGGGSVYWEPDALRMSGKDVLDKELDNAGKYYYFSSQNKQQNTSFNVYAGGPVIKDKLFIYGLIEGRSNTRDTFGENSSTSTSNNKPNGMLKVDFAPTSDHLFEWTGINNRREVKINDYTSATPYSGSHDGGADASKQTEGGQVNILKYTGYLTSDLTVSALVGRVNYQLPKYTGARNIAPLCPYVFDTDKIDPVNGIGGLSSCGSAAATFVEARDQSAKDDTDKRRAWRFDVDYRMGDHNLKAGYDYQNFKSYSGGSSIYGGLPYYRYYKTPAAGSTVNGVLVPGGTEYVRERVRNTVSGDYEVENKAIYIEDTWNVTQNVVLYAGIRSESFDNKNADGVSFIKADNEIAPRMGASWDVNGDSSLKVFGTAGRYYIPVASNTNIRSTASEFYTQRYYTFSGVNSNFVPQGLAVIGDPANGVLSDGRAPDPRTVADTKLQPMNQDEFTLGFQKALSKDLYVGVKAIYRRINDGMDDYCDNSYSDSSIERWALDNGYTNFDYQSAAGCTLMNPGKPLNIALDLNGDGNLVPVTIPNSYLGLAKYQRTYRGLEFTLDQPFNGTFGYSASYVWSKSKGTAEGYVQTTLNQEDAGITQDFDMGSFTRGANGYLPSDHRHVFKFYGNYAVTNDIRVGANLQVASGTPRSCIGYVPLDISDNGYHYSSASSYYCLNGSGTPTLGNRGDAGRTPWTQKLDLQVAYMPKMGDGKFTLQLDIFNVFNTQRVTTFNEVKDYGRETTGTSTDTAGRASANYLQPTSFQVPRYFRLTGRYEF